MTRILKWLFIFLYVKDSPNSEETLVYLSNDGQYIKEFACPVLILDHHIKESESVIPENMILINNQTSPNYKNKELCGGGVTWQFCRALDDFFLKDFANDYIDLAALSIIGDMMSLLNFENQYIIQTGLNNIKNKMFKTLLDKQSFSMGGQITPIKIAFYIVPLINAMIRVGTQAEKERLYLSFLAPDTLVDCNKRGAKGTKVEVCIESTRECVNAKSRQDKEKQKFVECLEAKIFKHDLLENQILFLRLDDDDCFAPELNGLAAMVCAAKYHKPTIVARLNEEGFDRGSARAPSNIELASFKEYLANTGLFEYTLGHDSAFGVSIPDTRLTALHQRANIDLAQYDFDNKYFEVDFERNASDKDLTDLIYDLSNYDGCWGQENSEPLIHIKNLYISHKDIQILGANKNTLKIVKNGVAYMKFFATELIEKLNSLPGENLCLEIVGKVNVNNWGGKLTPQIFIEQVEVRETSILDF